MTTHDWVRVSLSVPPNLYGDFLKFSGDFINERMGPAEAVATDQESREWLEADHDNDLERAVTVYGRLSDRGRSLFDLLIDNPEKHFTGEELAEILDIPNGKFGTAGTLAWPGRHSQAVDRKLPVSWDGESQAYWMTSDMATLFREARDIHDASD